VSFALLPQNDLKLMLCSEEVLVDFKELVGEHSGENLAEIVWSTLEMYGIEKKVRIHRNREQRD
jgi:hypothetical protein